MSHVGSNWDPSLEHQEGTEKPKPCCLIYNTHFDILQLGGDSEKCLSRTARIIGNLYFIFLFSNTHTYPGVSYCLESPKKLPVKMKRDREDQIQPRVDTAGTNSCFE